MFQLIYTFKVTHKLVAWLWVEAGADEGEDRQLLHLLFVCCKNIKTVLNHKTIKQTQHYPFVTTNIVTNGYI